MKKFLKILGGLVALILLALVLIPYFFKDQLVEKIKEKANEQLNAVLTFEDVDLTFFAHFPKLTLELHEFKISGIDQFEGTDLVDIRSLEMTIGLAKLFKGETPEIIDIYLLEPRIVTVVNEDGSVNWDIVKASEDTGGTESPESTSSDEFKMELQHYEIVDGWFSYVDKSADILFALENLQHQGSGDFGATTFNLTTTSLIDNMIIQYEGEKYIDNWKLDAKINIGVDLEAWQFTFKENEIKINDLLLQMEGEILMPDSSIDMDLKVNAPSFDLRQLISLMPPEYTSDLDGFTYKGTSKLSTWIKGSYSDISYPLFAVDMSVNNGSLQHKDLPKQIKDVEINAHVELPDAYDLDQLWIDISKFNIDLGGNPISAGFSLHKPMTSMLFDARVSASVDLNTLKDVLPSEDAASYAGIINANLQANGSLDEIAKENYSNLNSNGKLLVTDMIYNAASLSTPIFIDKLLMDFDMNEVNMEAFNARIGQSDFAASGLLRDFIPYALLDKEIYGELNLSSQYLNTDELMNLMLEDSSAQLTADTAHAAVAEESVQSNDSIVALLPKNIHFKFKAGIDKLTYEDYLLEEFKGDLELENGILNLMSSSARTLGGELTMSGKFDESIPASPLANFDFTVAKMSIKTIAEKSPLILKYAPIAKYTSGTFSGKIKLKTSLDKDWNPIYNSVYSKGNIKTSKVKIEGFKALEDLAAITKTQDILHQEFENMDIEFEIIDGKGYVKPFEFKIDQLKGTSYGTIDLDQNIDFDVNMGVPTVMLGSAANLLMGQLAGTLSGLGLESQVPEKIQMDIKITGTVEKPIIKPNFSGNATTAVKEVIKEQIQEEIEKVKEEAIDRAAEEAAKIMADARKQADQILKDAQKNVDALKKEGYAQADKLVEDAKNPLEKIAAKAAATEMKKQVDKQAENLMNEAKKKADKILQDAQNQADRIKN